MDDLLTAIAELGLELHPDRISNAASKIEHLESGKQFTLARSSFGPNVDKRLMDHLDSAWSKNKDISPREVASALRGASAAAVKKENRGAIELVWTGPSTGQVPIRHTEQVLCEVIASAKKRLFLVSFVAYEIDSICRALHEAVDRQVRISVLLEASEKHGGRVNVDSVETMRSILPSIDYYTWPSETSSPPGMLSGAVHAKCAVSDGVLAFITSANLTSAAMERNMELGVLVRNGSLPSELHRHLEALIATKVIKRYNN